MIVVENFEECMCENRKQGVQAGVCECVNTFSDNLSGQCPTQPASGIPDHNTNRAPF